MHFKLVYQGSTKMELWPRIPVKIQQRVIGTGDLHVTKLDTKNQEQKRRKKKRSEGQPLPSGSKRSLPFSRRKEFDEIHLHDCTNACAAVM